MQSPSVLDVKTLAQAHDHANATNGNSHGNTDYPGHRDDSAGQGAQTSEDQSDDDDEDDEDDSEADEEEEAGLGPVELIKQRLQAKQKKWMEARRDPLLEWKEEERWKREHEIYRIAAEQDRRRREEIVEERRAERERKQRRKLQQRVTKQKEKEFRETLFQYELDVVKSEKRAQVISAFQREDYKKNKIVLAVSEERRRKEEEDERMHQLANALKVDEEEKHARIKCLEENIRFADETGRRAGVLPAICTPAAQPKTEQDETSSILILRVNLSSPEPAQGALSRTSDTPGKRLFFTVNMKRFKHVDMIKGENIGDHGGVELARSLLTGACPRVKSIHLGWNQIKHSSLVALADSFVRGACGQLQVLDLRFNSIDANGVAHLLGALDQGGLPELHELNLHGNVIGDGGGKAFAHAMLRGTLKVLRIIDIRQNRIRNAGILALWNVFTAECVSRFCPKLQLLDLRRNEAQGSLTRTFIPCPPYIEF